MPSFSQAGPSGVGAAAFRDVGNALPLQHLNNGAPSANYSMGYSVNTQASGPNSNAWPAGTSYNAWSGPSDHAHSNAPRAPPFVNATSTWVNGTGTGRNPVGRPRKRRRPSDDEDYVPSGVKRERTMHEASARLERPLQQSDDLPNEIPITCQGLRGVFLMSEQKVRCHCAPCAAKGPKGRLWTPTQFENHSGAGSAKKWKASLKIEPGAIPELPLGTNPMPIGRWLDLRGVDAFNRPKAGAADNWPAAANGRPTHTAPPPAAPAYGLRNAPAASLTAANYMNGLRTASAGLLDHFPPPQATGKRAPPADKKVDVKKFWGDKEHPPWEEVLHGQYKPVRVKWAGDRCCVCDSDIDYDYDQLISCDACGVTVHQSCYGVPEAPGMEDVWMCRACELREQGAPDPACCLCPVQGGGLKPTTLPGLWCHAACMQCIPEVTCLNPARMEPIDRITEIQAERWTLRCSLCKQRMGAKIQCANCYSAYHPLCARMAGLHMEMVESAVGPMQLISYCVKHCRPRPELSGVKLIVDAESDKVSDGSENGLWNAQPFKPPPCAKPPACQQGCARAETFNGTRVFHGTGAGWTSNNGFWIPTCADAASASTASGKGAAAGGAPKRAGRSRKRSAAEAGVSRAVSEPRKAPRQFSKAPPAVELLPLPPGIPELVPIMCNGRSGQLNIRTQRVLHAGAETSASRFEQICGKGDAKKWKSSLLAEGDDGVADCSMQVG